MWESALLDVQQSRPARWQRFFFHPDNLTFGEGIFVSKIGRCASCHRVQKAGDAA
jgi:hypothetical protein